MVTTEKKKKKRSKMNEMESVGALQRTPAVCDTAIYIYIYIQRTTERQWFGTQKADRKWARDGEKDS